MEILLGAREAAPADMTAAARAKEEANVAAERAARKEQLAEAGGNLLGAAFTFLSQLLPAAGDPNPAGAAALRERLAECVDTGSDGRPRLTLTLPSADVQDALASALARLIPRGQ